MFWWSGSLDVIIEILEPLRLFHNAFKLSPSVESLTGILNTELIYL